MPVTVFEASCVDTCSLTCASDARCTSVDSVVGLTSALGSRHPARFPRSRTLDFAGLQSSIFNQQSQMPLSVLRQSPIFNLQSAISTACSALF